MKRYFYFRDVADEVNDDDNSSSVVIPVDQITGIVPTAITTLDLYYNHDRISDGTNATQKATLTVTRGKLQDVCAAIASAANAGPHHTGLSVVADIATTTNGASSIQGNDKSVPKIFTHADITAVAIA